MIIVEAVVCLLNACTWMFLYCYYATLISNSFDSINDIVYDSHWYTYPVSVQKPLMMMMGISQVPFKFDGLNMFECNIAKYGAVKKI